MNRHAAVILAGGAGTRLWPLSTEDNPKQFLEIFEGSSLLQRTAARLRRIVPIESIFIATTDRYRHLVERQLPAIPHENILIEPARRNTAPAIAACCAEIGRRLGDVTVAVFPSDHMIGDEGAFGMTLVRALEHASTHDDLVTIAIHPDAPETGYGYLELGEPLSGEVVRLRRFIEKPSREVAEQFLRAGNFAWNGGMFVWRLSSFERQLVRVAPELASGARRFASAGSSEERRSIYESMPSISIDYALMEKAESVAAVPGDFGWSDVGSWSAIFRILGTGDGLHALRSPGTAALDTASRPIAVVGLPNVAVVASERGILVLNLDDSDGLSELVRQIEGGKG